MLPDFSISRDLPGIPAQLSSFLQQQKPVIIFGAGNLGRKLATFLLSEKYNLVSFTDNNKKSWGTKVLGVEIKDPATFSADQYLHAVWIVGIWSPNHSYAVTKKQLASYGAVNVFPAAALIQLFPEHLLPHYHFQTADFFLSHTTELQKVYECLGDDESKQQFLAHVKCRVNLYFEGLPPADTANQYFPADIISLSDHEVFLDAGAFNGDTLLEFCKHTGNKFSKYLALEPDPGNYEQLQQVASTFEKDKIEVFPYAVGSSDGVLKFDATGGAGAGFSETGSIEVTCVRADDHFFNYQPTYLKFDIEGAELDALKGSEKIIETFRPKLAVCIYHLPEDLWQICLYLRDKYPFYRFFARTHQYDGLDFVLYAIPT